MEHRNAMASAPLILPILVLPNTPDEEIRRNVKINSARDLEWIKLTPEHDGVAVMVGGGGSIVDLHRMIRGMQNDGAKVFAMNAASQWLFSKGIATDYQCILDAKEETRTLVDPTARRHLIASQCHPSTMEAVMNPVVWHCNTGNIEQDFPPEKIKAGGYVLMSGGSACGNSALYAVYAMGYREFHIFGFDSCHRDGESHAYKQPMNRFIPNVPVKWGARTFTASVAMKAQAEDFQITSQALGQLGCKFHVYGDGLLQTMYRTKPENLGEREKYQTLWQFDNYREYSPGLNAVPEFLAQCSPDKDDTIIDFGCGTGKASIELSRLGYQLFLIDFTDNCRDEAAMGLPFLEWSLACPIPASAPYGFCCDVMEHIPTDDVATVIKNIMASAETVFFQISTVPDLFGKTIGQKLHLTVRDHYWWRAMLNEKGLEVQWDEDRRYASCFLVKNPLHSGGRAVSG